MDWVCPSIGVLNRDGNKSDSKGDFAIKLEMLIEAGSKTGYMATVKRAIDGAERYINACKEAWVASLVTNYLSDRR